MNNHILNTKIQDFINLNIESKIDKILLKGTAFNFVSTLEVVEQIEAKARCKNKLPSWFNLPKIYYPNKLNIEQTSSEVTAKYKTELIQGDTIIDITGGFGVDCFYFSKQFKNVWHCEVNKKLSKIVAHNYKQLSVNNINIYNTDGLEFIQYQAQTFDWIYIDPSRRHKSKRKVFLLKDCLPNIPDNLELLFKHANNLMIKTSPLLDISAGISELKGVKTIHVVAVNNEVKELLWILEKGFAGGILIETVNLKHGTSEKFSFKLNDEKLSVANYSEPLSYLYEPNVAILKSGAFHETAKQLKVYKLHQHSHLYTSETLVRFPGRRFKIENMVPYSSKALKRLGIKKANITTRNFPENVQHLRKKFKIADGGDVYLFFTTDINNHKIVLVTKKQHQIK